MRVEDDEEEEEEEKKNEIKRFRPKHNSISPSRIGQEGAKSIVVQRQYRIDAPRGRVGPAKLNEPSKAKGNGLRTARRMKELLPTIRAP